MDLTCSYRLTAADIETRTITGSIVPFGSVGSTSAGPTIIAAGSVDVPERVVMLVGHDDDRPVGRLTAHEVTDEGIVASFKIAATSTGDQALLEAAEGIRDGLSVGLAVAESHTDDEGNLTVTAATLREVSLVTFPAFEAARVSDVAADHHDRTTPPHRHPHDAPEPKKSSAPKKKEKNVDETTNTETVVEAAVTPEPAYVPARITAESFPYGTPATAGLSMFRDILEASHDPQAADRSRKAVSMLTAATGASATTDVAQIIPPGYRPDMYVGESLWGSPFRSSFTRHSISDATPFKIPAYMGDTGLAADHVEGTNPTAGSITFTEIVVTPKAISGSYLVTREALDAANPSLDAIIINALREAYDNAAETHVATQILAGATAGAAWPTTGFSAAVVETMAAFIGDRLAEADTVLVKPSAFVELATETDSSGRPMNPYLNPTNADGSLGAAAGRLNVAGITVRQAWSSTADLVVAKRSDAAVFESSMLGFRFNEKHGPAAIEFATFGYVAATVLRPEGVVKRTKA